jgi:ATP-dependent Lon protease
MSSFPDDILKQLMFNEEQEIIPILTDDIDDESEAQIQYPEILPILPLKNAVLFPGVVIPITVGREKSIQLIKEYNRGDKTIGTATQRDANIEDPQMHDLYPVGTLAQIVKIIEMPDGSTSVIIHGKRRITFDEQIATEPYLLCRVSQLKDIKPEIDEEFNAILETMKDLAMKIINMSSNIPNETSFVLKNIQNAGFLINFISSNVEAGADEKLQLLETDNLKDRAILLMKFMARQLQMLEIKNDILSKAHKTIDKQQREYFLQQQMRSIQDELGYTTTEREVDEYSEKAKTKKWSKEIAAYFDKELKKLQRMNPMQAEHSTQLTYIQTMLELPWNDFSEDNFDLQNAQTILDEDHFGLEKVKERILEHLAVLKLKGDMKSPIICLYGPPGVGKTSLGKSIAKALGRKYAKVSLGGLHDESEIRGHRRTYIGAMPGRIIQNLKRVGSSNPVFMLDEIDKVGHDMHGDPESALLEVLDPEQNGTFHDNYLNLDYDLSKVMFIATANNINNISPALRDRMEMIEVSGYVIEEKVEIAKRHLLPNQIINHGLQTEHIAIKDSVLENVIGNFTRESGVRQLDKKLAKIARSVAKKIAANEAWDGDVSQKCIDEMLGTPEVQNDMYQGNEYAGVVTGLAWTPVGGDILFIETSLSKGKGTVTLTGNLGNVMKESATLALEYLKAHAEQFNINSDIFEKWNVHVHVPEGAIPKDGPSAGITMATSIFSAFTQRKIRKSLAMTGELTLRGKILPVGGIKEKILAAKRANIKEIILCKENKKDIDKINKDYLKGLTFKYFETIQEVLDYAVLEEKVKSPINIS